MGGDAAVAARRQRSGQRRDLAAVCVALAIAVPPAHGAERPNIVLLAPVAGMAGADSSGTHAFQSAARGAFEPDFYLTESMKGGAPRVSMALGNTFRLVQGEPFGDEWQVLLTVATDSLPRILVHVAVLSPDSVASGSRPEVVAEEFSFDVPLEPRAAWFARAGRAAGLLAVEALHRRSGDLTPDTRVRIDQSARKPLKIQRSEPAR